MLKIVFDANIVISAGLKPLSVPSRAILLARSYATIVLSDAVETEIRAVIARPKFRAFQENLNLIVDAIAVIADRYQPNITITDCRDIKDNKYLELAAASDAAMIVSGDADLLLMHPWRNVPIVDAAEAVRRLEIAAAHPTK